MCAHQAPAAHRAAQRPGLLLPCSTGCSVSWPQHSNMLLPAELPQNHLANSVPVVALCAHTAPTFQQPPHTPPRPAAVPMAHWVNVLSVLNLSEQQKQAILAARERMIASLAPVLAERQQLAVRLAQAAAPTTMEYVQLSKTSLQVGWPATCCLGPLLRGRCSGRRRLVGCMAAWVCWPAPGAA